MNSIQITVVVFVCVFGGASLGMVIRTFLPESHLSDDSKDVLKLQMALISTMTALVLGLLITSAKNSYDAQSAELTQTCARVVLLDRILAHYGPETRETRGTLRNFVVRSLNQVWGEENRGPFESGAAGLENEVLFNQIQDLIPKDDSQTTLKAQALNILFSLAGTRWLQYAQIATSISTPLLVVLVLWLTTLFISFGIFAPRNGTVVMSFVIASLCVSCAVLLILDLYTPYGGLFEVSSAPMRAALAQLGR